MKRCGWHVQLVKSVRLYKMGMYLGEDCATHAVALSCLLLKIRHWVQ